VQAPPENIETTRVVEALRDGWGFEAITAEYAPVGFGSYHWVVTDRAGLRRFVTVDDLDAKAWLGNRREDRLGGLRAAFATAASLHDASLEFVVAPLSTRNDAHLELLDERHTVAVFPFLEGEAGEWGPFDDEGRRGVVELLAELHTATPPRTARRIGFGLSGRAHLEDALRQQETEWSGGPFSEPTRAAIRSFARDLVDLLGLADRLAAEAEARSGDLVVTHGEPHRGNTIRTDDGYVLVDWDTVALAPPERDLWFVVEKGTDAADRYEHATGRRVDETAIDYFRLTWDLKDLAEYLNVLRAPHEENEDTVQMYGAVTRFPGVHEQWASRIA
jgi:spectinomycin phosphotransferase